MPAEPAVKFRKTLPEDVDAAYAVIEQARRRIASLGIDQWQSGSPSRASVEGDAARGEGYVLDDGGSIVATAMMTAAGEPSYDRIDGPGWLSGSTSRDPRYLTVHRFAVADAALGKGLAKRMLAEAASLAKAAGLEAVRVDTHAGNRPMRSLLAACGFEECGVVTLDVDYDEPTLARTGYERLV